MAELLSARSSTTLESLPWYSIFELFRSISTLYSTMLFCPISFWTPIRKLVEEALLTLLMSCTPE